jgi:hypothetical protein
MVAVLSVTPLAIGCAGAAGRPVTARAGCSTRTVREYGGSVWLVAEPVRVLETPVSPLAYV